MAAVIKAAAMTAWRDLDGAGISTHSPEGGDGGRSRIRTYDPLIKSQLLYQLSYAPEHFERPINDPPDGAEPAPLSAGQFC